MLSPVYRKITYSSQASFSANLESPPEFDTPWHYHPEYELNMILGATGIRCMGDSIAEFRDFELMLVGPNLPHYWKENPVIHSPLAQAYVIHFSEEFLGKGFFEIPEGKRIKTLLTRSRQGLRFPSDTNGAYSVGIKKLFEMSEFDKILGLLGILNQLAKAEDAQQLSSIGFVNSFAENPSARINTVIEYSMTNFRKSIELETIAQLIHMSKPSFCRFFKRSTGKTYFDFLKELRIGYACKLLQESNLSVTQIAYECGYENISNFNRQFKELIATTPYTYRQVINVS